jgi:hypothetical protein
MYVLLLANFLFLSRYVPVLIETSSETEENEAEIALGGPSSPPADDSDSESSLTEAISVTSEVPREEPSSSPTGEASESRQPGRRWAR